MRIARTPEQTTRRRVAARPVRVDARVDAYVPASYIGSEALKIDLHRRLALTEDEDELRELQAATEDRYGPLPEPVESLFAIQEAKLKLARLGADYLVFRGGRATIGPVELLTYMSPPRFVCQTSLPVRASSATMKLSQVAK